MLRVAEGAFRAGAESAPVSRRYAQALIEEGLLESALAVLGAVPNPGAEAGEIDGLIGRAYKQRYIDSPTSPGAERSLARAIDAYLRRYEMAPDANLWHGINAVALLARAARDGRPTEGLPNWKEMARRILAAIGPPESAGFWDLGIGAEAHVAMGDHSGAAPWMAAYTGHEKANAFALAGTRRQLREVWRMDEGDREQRVLLELLEARLLASEGGGFEVDATARAGHIDDDDSHLQAVFGQDEYKTIIWYKAGLEAAKSVVRIVRPMGDTVGTGFVVPGELLHDSWKDQSVVVTNYHVASRKAVRRLRVVFEDNGQEIPIKDVLWESADDTVGRHPPRSLDVAILQLAFEPVPPPSYDMSPDTPEVGDRVYVIGYPRGQALAFSLQDNKLLGALDPLIHYRAPTRPGSSGSPVFDGEWRLVGIHHGGRTDMARLDDPAATYDANEGMLLSAIRERVRREIPSAPAAAP
jgi:S1-C subfamily serine protease